MQHALCAFSLLFIWGGMPGPTPTITPTPTATLAPLVEPVKPTPTPEAEEKNSPLLYSRGSCDRTYGVFTADVVFCMFTLYAPEGFQLNFGRVPEKGSNVNGFLVEEILLTHRRENKKEVYQLSYRIQAFRVFERPRSVLFGPIPVAWRDPTVQASLTPWNLYEIPGCRIVVSQVLQYDFMNSPEKLTSPPPDNRAMRRGTSLAGGALLIISGMICLILYGVRRTRWHAHSPFLDGLQALAEAKRMNARGIGEGMNEDAYALRVFQRAMRKALNLTGNLTPEHIYEVVRRDRRYRAHAGHIRYLWEMAVRMTYKNELPEVPVVAEVAALLLKLSEAERNE